MGNASSTKKIARMAQKGRGKKVRFQGGGVFPIAVIATIVLGSLLIVYSRSSISSEAAGPRASAGDHWHISYGFYACSTESADPAYLANLSGNIESSSKYLATGVHSHDDGVIHWHPSSAKASGANAKLGVFLDNYGVELSDEKLQFPADQLEGQTYEEGVTKCKTADGKEVDGVLKAFVWQQASNPAKFRTLTAGLNDIRITENGMAITIAFVPEDTESIPEPPTASKLPELGAADSGGVTPTDSTVATGDTSVTDSTVATGDTVATDSTEAQTATTVAATTTTS